MKGDDKMIKWSKNYLMGIDKFDEEPGISLLR